MEMKGQGAIEYLLIIGAAILVVAVVIIALTSVTGTGADAIDTDSVDDSYSPLQCQVECNQAGGTWNSTKCDDNTAPMAPACNIYATVD